MGLLKLLSHKKPAEGTSRQANQSHHPHSKGNASPVLDEVRPRRHDSHDSHDLDINHAKDSAPAPHVARCCKEPEAPSCPSSAATVPLTKITSTSGLSVGPVKLKKEHVKSPLPFRKPNIPQSTQASGSTESFASRRGSMSSSLLLSGAAVGPPAAASAVHVRGFIDILDAQSEIRPSDFRSRVRAAGARDFGEDVAERNLGQNGTDLSSEAVKEFYAREPTMGHGDDDSLAREGRIKFGARQATQVDNGLGSRKSRSMTGLYFNFQLNHDIAPASHIPQTNKDVRRQSITGFPSSTPASIQSEGTLRERRSRPPSMIKTDLRPGTASNSLGFTPPAIPDHTPPISPRTLRDSVLLTKEKQASSPLSRTNPDMIGEIGIAQSSYDDDLTFSPSSSSCAPPPHEFNNYHDTSCGQGGNLANDFCMTGMPRSNENENENETPTPSCKVDDYSTPALMSAVPSGSQLQLDGLHSSPLATTPHPQSSQTISAPHSMRRHWSFSSTTPTTASTSSSNPFSFHRPQSRHTAGTSIEEAPGVICPLSRRGSFESVIGGPKPDTEGHPLCCTVLQDRVLLSETLPHQPADEEPTYTSSEFTLDDYLSSDDADSLYSRCDPIDVDGPVPGSLKPRTPRTCEDDGDLLFRDTEYGVHQPPGLVDSVPETGIATAIPLPCHPLSAVTTRPPSMITITARHAQTDPSLCRNQRGGSLSFGNPGRSAFDFSDSDDSDDGAGDNDGSTDDRGDKRDLAAGARGTRRISALGASPTSGEKNDKAGSHSAAQICEEAKMRSRVAGGGLAAWRRGMVMADNYNSHEYDETGQPRFF